MDQAPVAQIVELVEAELWFPPKRALRRAAQWLLDLVEDMPRRDASVLETALGLYRSGPTLCGLLAAPAYLPFEAAARAVEAGDRRRLQEQVARQRGRLEQLEAQLEAIRNERGEGAALYRAGAQSLAEAPPEILELLGGGTSPRLVSYRISTDRDWPDLHTLYGLLLATTTPAALLAHLWDEGDEASVTELAEQLEACLARCLPTPVPLERWAWKLGDEASLRVSGRRKNRQPATTKKRRRR